MELPHCGLQRANSPRATNSHTPLLVLRRWVFPPCFFLGVVGSWNSCADLSSARRLESRRADWPISGYNETPPTLTELFFFSSPKSFVALFLPIRVLLSTAINRPPLFSGPPPLASVRVARWGTVVDSKVLINILGLLPFSPIDSFPLLLTYPPFPFRSFLSCRDICIYNFIFVRGMPYVFGGHRYSLHAHFLLS